MRRDAGQAAVELAVLAPVLALAVLVFAQLALAFRAQLAAERAAGRAQAAAVLGHRCRPPRSPGARRARARAYATARSRSRCRAGCACRCRSSRGYGSRGRSRRVPRDPARRARRGRGRRRRSAARLALVAGSGLVAGRGSCSTSAATARPMPWHWPRRACSSGATATTSTAAVRRAVRRPSARRVPRPSASRSGSARRSSRSSSSAGRATRHRSRYGCAYAWVRSTIAAARAGIGFAQPTATEGFRLADVRGLDAAGAVVAAALAQLGWPYVWGGESRAEGGFDCSGLVDYALAAAGLPVGRLDAAGLQRLARAPARGATAASARRSRLRQGSGASLRTRRRPRASPLEAPHRGARSASGRLGDGGWTGAGRILQPRGPRCPDSGDELAYPPTSPPD